MYACLGLLFCTSFSNTTHPVTGLISISPIGVVFYNPIILVGTLAGGKIEREEEEEKEEDEEEEEEEEEEKEGGRGGRRREKEEEEKRLLLINRMVQPNQIINIPYSRDSTLLIIETE